MLERLTPALEELGDVDRVTSGVQQLLDQGTGAARQRAALAKGGTEALLDLIAPQPTHPASSVSTGS